jgi:predicted phage baseplate assembly protein
MGRAGEVAAGKLTLLGSRPLGVRGVVNPGAASGAEDPEPIDAARSNALRTVRTLDRIVSLTDFEDFARGFAGIAKARAVELWDGHGRLAHLTIAGFGGVAIAASSELYRNLLRAIADLSDGIERCAVQSFVPHQIALEANLLIAHGYRSADVLGAATELAAGAYAFAARELAQPVTEADVVTRLSAVPGVTAVKVTRLHRLDRDQAAEPVIAASDARWNAASAQVDPAELLTLLPANLRLTAVSP